MLHDRGKDDKYIGRGVMAYSHVKVCGLSLIVVWMNGKWRPLWHECGRLDVLSFGLIMIKVRLWANYYCAKSKTKIKNKVKFIEVHIIMSLHCSLRSKSSYSGRKKFNNHQIQINVVNSELIIYPLSQNIHVNISQQNHPAISAMCPAYNTATATLRLDQS